MCPLPQISPVVDGHARIPLSRPLLTRAVLLDRLRAGATPRFVYFWGTRSRFDGWDLGCLSQWSPSPFVVDGVTYPTAEHYMMAAKARLFADPAGERKILATVGPRAAKEIGRTVAGFTEARWRRHRDDITIAANVAKFQAHASMRNALLATGDRVLVEASPYDRVWGIGVRAGDPRAAHPASWLGDNRLGFVLMYVREYLRGR